MALRRGVPAWGVAAWGGVMAHIPLTYKSYHLFLDAVIDNLTDALADAVLFRREGGLAEFRQLEARMTVVGDCLRALHKDVL